MKYSLLSAAVIGALFLTGTGCSSSHSVKFEEAQTRAENNVNDKYKARSEAMSPKRQTVGKIEYGNKYHDVNNYELIETDERKLPSAYMEEAFSTGESAMTIDEFAVNLYEGYGIVLDVSSTDLKILAGESLTKGKSASGDKKDSKIIQGVSSDATGDFQNMIDLTAQKDEGSNRDSLILKPVKFDGTVKGMLDYVSILNGLKWKYDAEFNRAYLYVYETREFSIYDFADARDQKTSISNSTSQQADSTSGGSSRQFTKTGKIDPWEEITESIENMLSDDGGSSASFDQKTGLVIVKDNDYNLSRIHSYIERLNKASTTEVNVQYRMVRVKYTDLNTKGLDINFLNNGLKNNVFGSFNMEAGLGGLSPNIAGNLSTLQEISQGNYLTLANKSFGALMGFLNQVGTAEIAYHADLSLVNNEVYTHQGGKNKEYISSIERSSFKENGEDNITTKKDVAVDGINLSLKPRVIGDRVLLDYSVATSDFEGLDDAGLGTGLEGVKLKRDSSLDIGTTAVLENGETRILQMVHESEETTDTQGFFDEAFWFLGGKENRETQKSMILITVTAYYNN
jgi:type IVB pilus formation R64 PilN family outer membrane protein